MSDFVKTPKFRAGYYPPSGFQVTLPDGSTILEGDFAGLVEAVRARVPMPSEEATAFVHARLCAKYPTYCEGGVGTANAGMAPGDRAALWLTRVFDNAKAYADPAPRPNAAETKSRQETCRACPNYGGSTAPGCCGTPKTIEGLARSAGMALGVSAPLREGWCGTLGWNIKIASEVLEPTLRGIDGVDPTDAVYPRLPANCPYKR